MADQRKTVAVVDGNSLIHRAFHAISANMTAPDGTPTNAVWILIWITHQMIRKKKLWKELRNIRWQFGNANNNILSLK